MEHPPPPSLIERVETFVSENKRVIILGTAALAALAGVAYYASTSRGTAEGDVEKGRKDKKKSKKRKGKDRDDSPILEEKAQPKVEVEEEDHVLTVDEIIALSIEERKSAAAALKAKGNTAYQQHRFQDAIDLYSRAIAVTPKPEPVFFSNRAACYVNLSPPQHNKVVEDCNEALKLDPKYIKALNRRAGAYEALGLFEAALRDFTAATILDGFKNDVAAQSVERVLKKLSAAKAEEIISTRDRRLPSHTFVSAYFGAFRTRPLPALPENPAQGDSTLILALEALAASDYTHSWTLVNEAIEQGISWDTGKAEALNLRGTYKFLMTDVLGAKEDFLASIELQPSLTQTWVKIASVYMEQGDPKKAFECFEEAIKHNPKDPDIYYHRGQVLFIMNEFTEAAENYTKSTELDDQFVFSHIQLAVAQYKSNNLANSMATFRRTLKAFPNRSEPHNYYGELLLDQQRFQDAVEKFDRAVELEELNPLNKPPPKNVLPQVNKGLALYQWKQDIAAAERCCQEALQIDPECEAAVATLAQLSLQQGKTDQAMEMFRRQAELARSEPELVNALTYQYATKAQIDFVGAYPDMGTQLGAMARAMM